MNKTVPNTTVNYRGLKLLPSNHGAKIKIGVQHPIIFYPYRFYNPPNGLIFKRDHWITHLKIIFFLKQNEIKKHAL